MPTKQPSFAERCCDMHDAAEELKEIAEIVPLEAIRMATAEKRFSGRRGPKSERRARE